MYKYDTWRWTTPQVMHLLCQPLTSWYVVTNILEENATSKILITSYQTMWCHKPQVHKASLHDQETLRFHTLTHNCLNTSHNITDFSSSNYIQYTKHLKSALWFLNASFPNKILHFPNPCYVLSQTQQHYEKLYPMSYQRQLLYSWEKNIYCIISLMGYPYLNWNFN
jgi:hypothetical protein